MSNQHPITPPPELVQQWREESSTGELHFSPQYLATCAAQWGADQELEACCEEFSARGNAGIGTRLRAARRPKPPTLKEQALDALNLMLMFVPPGNQLEQGDIIRRAIEALPDD